MAKPPPQDQFIDDDDEEEVCPLCVEEFDLTDKNFRPCPCGYQVSLLYMLRVPLTAVDMSVLLQQHQDDNERPLPGLPTTVRRANHTIQSRQPRRVGPLPVSSSF
jgi:RING/Ubox like zinc-binding domain